MSEEHPKLENLDPVKSERTRLETPYYQTALQVLTRWFNFSLQDATELVKTLPFDALEEQIGAKDSIEHAIDYLNKYNSDFYNPDLPGQVLEINGLPSFKAKLSEFVYEGKGNVPFMPLLALNDPTSLIMDTLFAVHDGWVKDHPEMFSAREKKHQHLPSELIGWKEVTSDLIFVKPIFEALGINVDEKELEKTYNQRVTEFFIKNGIRSVDDLVTLISGGEGFYPQLSGYSEDDLAKIHNIEFVRNIIIPQIAAKGIGDVESVRKNIMIPSVAQNPVPDTITQLEPTEQEKVARLIEEENKRLTSMRDELHNKNEVIRRIRDLVKTRNELQAQIHQEEKIRKEQGEITTIE